MPNIRFLAKRFFRCFVHKDAYVQKRGVTQPKIHGIGSNVYQFIYTLICNDMQKIRIIGSPNPKNYGICSKVNQFIYILVCNYKPHIRVIALAVLQILYSQGGSYIVEKGA